MKIIILGAGQVGQGIAACLSSEENDITIVDQSPEILKKISDTIDVQPIHGFASHPDVLEKAGASEAELIVAVTGSDEVNLVACEIANSLYGVKTKIARLRQQSYLNPSWRHTLFAPDRLAIDVIISPEVEVARTIARSVRVPGAFEVLSLANGYVKVIGVRCHQSAMILNTPLRLLPTSFSKLNITILWVNRENNGFIPAEDDMIKPGDEVYFAIAPSQVNEAMEAFGVFDHEGRRLVVLGGGNIGVTLADEIENLVPELVCKVIERDPERAEFIAHQLRNTEVLCGDALDLEVLTEANIQDSETVVAVTQDDKVNILSSLLVKREGAKRTMTLLNNMDYAPLVSSLGIDAVISPQAVTVSTILQHIRQGRIRSVYSIYNGLGEIIESEARETSHVIGLTVSDLNVPNAVRVIALIRDQSVLLSPEKQLIRNGDRFLFVVTKTAIKKMETLFATRPSYL